MMSNKAMVQKEYWNAAIGEQLDDFYRTFNTTSFCLEHSIEQDQFELDFADWYYETSAYKLLRVWAQRCQERNSFKQDLLNPSIFERLGTLLTQDQMNSIWNEWLLRPAHITVDQDGLLTQDILIDGETIRLKQMYVHTELHLDAMSLEINGSYYNASVYSDDPEETDIPYMQVLNTDTDRLHKALILGGAAW